jgi:hypothetical protein
MQAVGGAAGHLRGLCTRNNINACSVAHTRTHAHTSHIGPGVQEERGGGRSLGEESPGLARERSTASRRRQPREGAAQSAAITRLSQ